MAYDVTNYLPDDWRADVTEYLPLDMPPYCETELRLRGCPVDPYFGNRFDNARLYAGAGFTRSQIATIFEFDEDDLDAVFDKISPSLPDVLTLHAAGLTVKQISEETGVARGAIYYYLDVRHLLPNRTGRRPLTEAELGKVIKMRRKGKTVVEIAKAVDASERQIEWAVRNIPRGTK